tara:strand:+ start:332 stop:631 length:300 start_codon:yes stop_codon:yes gene_type:complete
MELDTADGRKKYLSEKLDNLLDGINESYGKMLLEELVGRLETTIKDFNDEIVELCSRLSEKEKERQHVIDMMKSENVDSGNAESATEWEKKLEEIEKDN